MAARRALRAPGLGPSQTGGRLDELTRQGIPQALVEVATHLDGNLTIQPLLFLSGLRQAEIRVRAKTDGLLGGQEAVVYAGR